MTLQAIDEAACQCSRYFGIKSNSSCSKCTDIRDDSKYADVVKQVDEATQGAGLNLLINNAGIYTNRPQNLENITKETMLLHFEVNTIAPLILAKVILLLQLCNDIDILKIMEMRIYELRLIFGVLIALFQAFLPLLEKAANSSSGPLGINRAAIVNVSSLMGSVADNGSGGEYAYRSSKVGCSR